ncbi:TetR/AcrR family transcriptional regulator; helix-turn-helix transcriptional regulator [Novosphingobium sp. G106]|uniref:TetR/AcrR family transcriptional regulator n=1 Tax=Novosphingobium sp. G106 TaxID=2849500 RepID=UPI001C2CF2C9|nr:TetR/AcrR family transcriptional regulator [Novosphingobium sp. G106]MBV1687184.1 TetR/AcrR family transcriptional regulator; helix-turn-helix transcriptional regulator [Novosphingobium sp. G106]
MSEALLALLERKPFEAISARDLTAEAGIGYSTFFRQYGTKEALLEAIASQELHDLLSLTRPGMAAEDSLGACIALCRHVDESRRLWSILLGGGAAPAIRREFLKISQELADVHPAPQAWLTADLGVRTAVSTIIEILSWWIEQDQPQPAEWVAEAIERLALRPIKPA